MCLYRRLGYACYHLLARFHRVGDCLAASPRPGDGYGDSGSRRFKTGGLPAARYVGDSDAGGLSFDDRSGDRLEGVLLMSHGALHGGMSFQAIGVDLSAPERERDVVTADVLDSWFDPSPRVLERLRNNLPFLLRNSPPLYAEGMVQEIARARGRRQFTS